MKAKKPVSKPNRTPEGLLISDIAKILEKSDAKIVAHCIGDASSFWGFVLEIGGKSYPLGGELNGSSCLHSVNYEK